MMSDNEGISESPQSNNVESENAVNEEKNNNNEHVEQAETEKNERLTRLPLARIRTLVKADQDVTIASQESVFLITKATELFIETVAKEMHRVTLQQKRKTIYRRDIDAVIEAMDEYAFLEGVLD